MQMVLKMDSLFVVIDENIFQRKQHIYANKYVDETHMNNVEEIFQLIQEIMDLLLCSNWNLSIREINQMKFSSVFFFFFL